VKIRFGVGSGPGSAGAELTALVDRMEELRLDSVWFSELVTAPQVEPVVGMAWTAARTRRLKVGTGVTVLPGRHPVLVAKQLASLAALAPKRILPVFGLQAAREHERAFFPVAGRRGDVFDESMVLLRRLLTEQRVTFSGEFFSVEDVGVGLLPPEAERLWTLNAVRVPRGVDEAAVRQTLLTAFNIEVGSGLGPLAGKIWRVGLMGASSTPHTVLQFLAAFESALEMNGHRARSGAGVAAAAQALREQPATV